MSVLLKQASVVMNKIDLESPEVKQAKELFAELEKTSGVTDLIGDPRFQNVINLLTPYLVNYKVNQVLKLLKELAKESTTGTGTSYPRHF